MFGYFTTLCMKGLKSYKSKKIHLICRQLKYHQFWISLVNLHFARNYSRYLHMFDRILSTQILILALAPLVFISVSILCEFAMLPDVYILLFPQEEEVHSSSMRDRCKHLAVHSSKRLNPSSVTILVCLGNT